jgi:hypothetical protein
VIKGEIMLNIKQIVFELERAIKGHRKAFEECEALDHEYSYKDVLGEKVDLLTGLLHDILKDGE